MFNHLHFVKLHVRLWSTWQGTYGTTQWMVTVKLDAPSENVTATCKTAVRHLSIWSMDRYWMQLLRRISTIAHICFGVGLALCKPAELLWKSAITVNRWDDAIVRRFLLQEIWLVKWLSERGMKLLTRLQKMDSLAKCISTALSTCWATSFQRVIVLS